MTWAKYGVEFFDQLAEAGLSDAAVRTHAEALHYLYRLEHMDMRIAEHLVRRFAGSADWEQATKELIAAGFWRDVGDAYVVEHHADVFRQSLAAQLQKRETEKHRQRQRRAREAAAQQSDVGTNVGPNVRPTQTDSLSSSQTEHLRDSEAKAVPNQGVRAKSDLCPDCGHWLNTIGHQENCEKTA